MQSGKSEKLPFRSAERLRLDLSATLSAALPATSKETQLYNFLLSSPSKSHL